MAHCMIQCDKILLCGKKMKAILLWVFVTVLLIVAIFSLYVFYTKNDVNNIIPLRDFFRNSEQANFQVSPNAKYASYTKPQNNRMNVFIQQLSADRLPSGIESQITFVNDRDVGNYLWKGDDTILYMKDFGGDENYHIHAVDVATKTDIDLTPFADTRVMLIDDLKNISDTDVLIATNQRDKKIFDVYRLNVKTGAVNMIAENSGKIDGWMTDHNGKLRVAIESDGLVNRIYSRATEEEPFKQIVEFDYKNEVSPLLFDPDNKDLYVRSNLGRDKTAIVKLDSSNGQEIEVIFDHPEVDVASLGYSEKRKVITAASYTTWKQERKFFDQISAERYAKIKQKIGEKEIFYTSYNDDEDLFVVLVTDDKSPSQYYLYDDKNDKLTLLANTRPWLDSTKLASMKPIQYQSRDDLTIHGYLTLPKNSSGKNLPVVVIPHGGPWGVRDSWGYDPEVQFLANRGYAVLQMNFRGSGGYGKEFLNKSFKQWGKDMQNDITDGVYWLIKQGIADPTRVGIYGASYGGYATLAGLTFTPDLYACGVDYVGPSNLFTLLKNFPPYWQNFMSQSYEMVGDPEKDKELLQEISPLFHVENIKAPLFVAQGAKDPRVTVLESEQIVNALRERGIEVQYMLKENEGHGFANEENRLEFYEAMEKFLHQCLIDAKTTI